MGINNNFKLRFFVPVTPNSLPELKRQYHALALKFHPDYGGTNEDMRDLNREYEYLFNNLKNKKENFEGEVYTSKEETKETPEQFINIVEALINCHGMKLELCGDWLWASGTTMPYKERLKELNFFWCSGKKVWGFNFDPRPKKVFTKRWSMDKIRSKFGSQNIPLPTSRQIDGRVEDR